MSAKTLGKRKARDGDTLSSGGHGRGSTLFVSNLPYDATSTDLQTAFSDLAPVRSAFVVLERGSGVSKGVGYISFSIKEDAQMAFESITTNGMTINGRHIRVQWAESKPKNKTKDRPKVENATKEREILARKVPVHKVKTEPSRAGRLIVRNLPFDITEQDLRAVFLPYGPIHSIDIPTVGGDNVQTVHDAQPERSSKAVRSKGFAFVWMSSKKNAGTALQKCNGIKIVAGMGSDVALSEKKVKRERRKERKRHKSEDGEGEEAIGEPSQTCGEGNGRVIAVDWALGKDKWLKEKEGLERVVDDVEMDDSENEASVSEDNGVGSEDEQARVDVEDSEDEDEKEDDDSEVGETPERDSDDESPRRPQLPHTDTGSTLFIRNIPFTATEDELRTLFRAFGPLRYVRLTVDPETDHPRGTGFACFWNKEDADKAITQSETLRLETMGTQSQPPKNPFSLPSLLTPDPSASVAKNLVLHGRTLDVVRAVTREQATKLKEDGEKSREKADKRNLYLLREGVILPNSPAAETIPPVELEKRTNSFNARRTMLRSNPSLYVSRTRLSIRQMPLSVTERALKRLAVHSVREFDAEVKKGVREGLSPDELVEPVEADDGSSKGDVKAEHDMKSKKRKVRGERPTSVKQAKIVRESDRVDPVTGKGRSRGYGFVEMHTHADALRVLRWANNNADVGVLFDRWRKEELADLIKLEKTKDSPDESRIKRIKDEMAAPLKPVKGTLIVEFSIENIQVVQRRTAQKERQSQLNHTRRHAPSTEEPPSKKRRVSSDQTKSIKTVRIKEERPKPGKTIGSMIGRKRRARKAGKSAR